MKFDITEIHSFLSEKEMRRFGKFLLSPFFNTEKRFVQLFELIRSSRGPITREKIAQEIYGSGVNSNDTRCRKLVSEFMDLFRKYLSELETESDIISRKFALMKQLSKRGLNEDYLREAKKTEELIGSAALKNENYYSRMLELYINRYRIEGFNYNSWENDLSFLVGKFLDRYFTNLKVYLYQRFQSIEISYHPQSKLQRTFHRSVHEYIKKNKDELLEEHSDTYLQFIIYEMIANPDQKELFDECMLILGHLDQNPEIECKAYYEGLINYFTLLVNSGRTEFEQNIFVIAKILVEQDSFKSGIEVNDFKIIIEAAIGLKEYDWAEEFAEHCKSYINDRYRESIYSACMAKIAFFKKEYTRARSYISKVVYDDFSRYIEAKFIECRILYEDRKIDELLLTADSAIKYLGSHREIGTQLKERYSTFLRFMRMLVNIYELKQAKQDVDYEIRKFESEICSREQIFYGEEWIIEKINEIKTGRL